MNGCLAYMLAKRPLSIAVALAMLMASDIFGQRMLVEDFENMEAGKPPSPPWDARSPGGYSSIRITDEKAVSGKHSLAISCDVPLEDRHKVPLPLLMRPIPGSFADGTAIFEGCVLFSPGSDTRIVIALAGGPMSERSVSLLNSMGTLKSAALLVWNPVLVDRWYHFRFTIHKYAGTADLEVSEQGSPWKNHFCGLPLGKPEDIFPINSLVIYFGGPAKKGVCAYFDDLRFETHP